jgi:catechol 2,3-dioxygenase-like lactoylglutathione lyase family enzyme
MHITIASLTLEVTDPSASESFYEDALGVRSRVRARVTDTPATGFRGFTISLVVGQPSTVDSLLETALAGGAKTLKAAQKGMWGYGAVVQDADGVVWKLATSAKKDKGAASRAIDHLVLLIGAADLRASKRFYVERGLSVKRSFPGRYVEFDAPEGAVTLALYPGRAGLAKDAGVSPEGNGPHGLGVNSSAGQFSDPDGFSWEAAED